MAVLPLDEIKFLDATAEQLAGTSDNYAIWIAIIPTWKRAAQMLSLREQLIFFRQCLKQFEIPNPGLLSMSAFYHPNTPGSLRRIFESIAAAFPQPASRADRQKWLYECCVGATHLRGTIRVIETCALSAVALAESQTPPIDSVPIASLASLGTFPTTMTDVDSAIKLSDRLWAIARIQEQKANEKPRQKSQQQREQKPAYNLKIIFPIIGGFGWVFWLGWALPDFIKNYEEPWFKHWYVPLLIICFGVGCYLILKKGLQRRFATSVSVSIFLTSALAMAVKFGYDRRVPPIFYSVRMGWFSICAILGIFAVTALYRYFGSRPPDKPAILKMKIAPKIIFITPNESSAVLPPLAPGPWMESFPTAENSQG